MNECLRCTRLVDVPGLCTACTIEAPQRVTVQRTRGRNVSSTIPTGKRLGAEGRQLILELTDRGLGIVPIALRVGCSSRTVSKVRAARQVTR